MKTQLEFTNLVKKQGATLGLFKNAFLSNFGVRECPFFIPEQFTLDQGAWDGGAVNRNKLFVGAL